MFLKKLFNFNKDFKHYLEKGDRYAAAERYADARNAYSEALEKLEMDSEADPSVITAVREKIAFTGNMLGRLNLIEAEHAIAAREGKKAEEHLLIIMELADDASLRESAERLLESLHAGLQGEEQVEAVHDCAGYEGRADETEDDVEHDMEGSIAAEDRLALYFQTLPGDLPERYAGMGEEFARGCLLNLDGKGEEALRVFEELSATAENDILDYERAILHFHNGDPGKCEQLLLKAIGLNPANPLCNIGLVHLYSDTDRVNEALLVVERMISGGVIPQQARLMQGDLHILLQDEAKAIDSYSTLLEFPQYAKAAAERLIPLLERQGRAGEAACLAKKFIKGCR